MAALGKAHELLRRADERIKPLAILNRHDAVALAMEDEHGSRDAADALVRAIAVLEQEPHRQERIGGDGDIDDRSIGRLQQKTRHRLFRREPDRDAGAERFAEQRDPLRRIARGREGIAGGSVGQQPFFARAAARAAIAAIGKRHEPVAVRDQAAKAVDAMNQRAAIAVEIEHHGLSFRRRYVPGDQFFAVGGFDHDFFGLGQARQRGRRAGLHANANYALGLRDRCRGRATSMSTSGWIFLGVVGFLIVLAVFIYNGLVTLRQRVNQAFADIDVQLKQRHDLIPNLIETVKGYAAHERGTLDAVVQARNVAMAAQGPAQQAAAENALSGALRQLFALSEAYPDLKANTNFQELQAELTDLENKIAASRRFFNNAVQEYNTGIQQFPAALFASTFGFTPHEYFEAGEERKVLEQAPQVKF